MAFISYGVNVYGIPISIHRCSDCGAKFTVCPPAKNPENWGGCLAPNCSSYDLSRDVDKLFEPNGKAKVIEHPNGSCEILPQEGEA